MAHFLHNYLQKHGVTKRGGEGSSANYFQPFARSKGSTPMLRIVGFLTFLQMLVCVLQTGLPAAVKTRARSGSFAYYVVLSVDSLVDQMTGNPVVAKRYATHFGMPADAVAKYCRENLKAITLKKPTAVTSYFISRQGRILSKKRTLPKGALVFINREGQLIIQGNCGNPLTKRLPASKPVTKVKAAPETIGTLPAQEETMLSPAVSVEPEAIETVESSAFQTLPETVVIAEPLTAAITDMEPVVTSASPATESAASSILRFADIAVPLLLGAVAARSDKDSPPPPYVPEPNPCIATAVAALTVALGWRKTQLRAPRR